MLNHANTHGCKEPSEVQHARVCFGVPVHKHFVIGIAPSKDVCAHAAAGIVPIGPARARRGQEVGQEGFTTETVKGKSF